MRVKKSELTYALGSAPTLHWRGLLHVAISTIKAGTIAEYDGVLIVDDTAWRDAMRSLRHLPAGGRHVAKARWELDLWLNKALAFN